MSGDLQSQSSELFVEMSDGEQETIGGGCGCSGRGGMGGLFFFSSEETEIETGSESEVSFGGSRGLSARGSTSYSLSQRKVSFGGFLPFGGGSSRFFGGRNSMMRLFAMMLRDDDD
jgi:hypothetical protein